MNHIPRHLRLALVALSAIVATSSGEASASTARSGTGIPSCARKCCTKPIDSKCCCRTKPSADGQSRTASPMAQVQSNPSPLPRLSCDCTPDVPASPADRDSSVKIKTYRVDLRPLLAEIERIDPIDGKARRAIPDQPTPFKNPIFLRNAHLLI